MADKKTSAEDVILEGSLNNTEETRVARSGNNYQVLFAAQFRAYVKSLPGYDATNTHQALVPDGSGGFQWVNVLLP